MNVDKLLRLPKSLSGVCSNRLFITYYIQMAKARQLPSGKWNIQVRRKNLPTISRTFTTEQKANDWAHAVEAEIVDGTFQQRLAQAAVPSVIELIKDFELDHLKPKGKTIDIVRLKHFRNADLSTKQIQTVDHFDVEQYIAKRLGEGVKGDTVNRELNLLRSMFNYARKKYKAIVKIENPVVDAEKPANSPSRDRRVMEITNPKTGLPLDELNVILSFTKSDELKAFVRIANETAMRRGEIVKIQVERVKLISKSDLPLFGTLHIPDTKTKVPRTIPLSPEATALLVPLIEGKKPSDTIFTSAPHSYPTGMRRARSRAREAYELLCKEHEIEPNHRAFLDLRIHDQRHEATSIFFEDDELNPIEVAAITGHQDPRMLKGYANLDAAKLAEKITRRRHGKPSSNSGTTPNGKDIASRIRELKGLLNEKLITKKAFDTRLGEILTEV
ncbi:MAG: site-specific integrase [Georgfuchsia sp.]